MKNPTPQQIAAMEKAAQAMQKKADALNRKWCVAFELYEMDNEDHPANAVCSCLDAVSASLEELFQHLDEMLGDEAA